MSAWNQPPQKLLLAANELHVWRVALALSERRLEQLLRQLDTTETARAERFHFERDRRRFLAARGQLRELLGFYVGLPPAEVRFRYGERGKPFLDLEQGPDIRFNLAHSGDLALVAVSRGHEVGVDLEEIRPVVTEAEIAERFFSPTEVVELRSLPPVEHRTAFYRCWTRKEAYLKGVGDGIAFGLDQFSVSFAPGVPPELLDTPLDPPEAARWSFYHLEPGPGFTGAVAVRAIEPKLRCWDLTG